MTPTTYDRELPAEYWDLVEHRSGAGVETVTGPGKGCRTIVAGQVVHRREDPSGNGV